LNLEIQNNQSDVDRKYELPADNKETMNSHSGKTGSISGSMTKLVEEEQKIH
jgi:hypothetical protein